MAERYFHVSAGTGDMIASHQAWEAGGNDPTEVSLTFSGQIASFIRARGGKGYLISRKPDGRRYERGDFIAEHVAHPGGRGIGWIVGDLRHAWSLVRRARAWKADVALIDSGTTQFFMMALFPLFGIKVVPILHNTLWAHGFRPQGRRNRLVQWLDGLFFTHVPVAVISVSPEVERQFEILAPRHRCPSVQIRAQFQRAYFDAIPPPPAHGSVPLQIMFIGRVAEEKGVLDIPDMARWIEDRRPGLVRWTICGRGVHYDRLVAKIGAMGLGDVVHARGWTSLEELQQVYAASHASIVPTRSLFAEGLAMTAVEAVLAGRPVVTNPVVPAHELIAPACILGRTNDPVSHAEAVLALAEDGTRYEAMRAASPDLRAPFYDREQGLTAVLDRLFNATASRS